MTTAFIYQKLKGIFKKVYLMNYRPSFKRKNENKKRKFQFNKKLYFHNNKDFKSKISANQESLRK